MQQVSLHDIDNVEAFVVMCVKRSGAQPTNEEWPDLVAEGICLLYAMAGNYIHHMEGYSQAGKFSGYALNYLPKKIKEAWHRGHEEHLQVTEKETGKRRWKYCKKRVSYDQLTANDEETVPLDERTLRFPGNFINPPTSDTGG
jgi:hypothetical protein